MADVDLGTARGRIEIDADGARAGFGRAAAGADDFGKRSHAAAGLAGAALVGAGLAIAGGLGVAIKAASDFETRISAIKAVSGATADEMDIIRKKALQLGADTKFSAGEAAGAMEELIKAGLSVADVMDGAADATVALAAAGEIDLKTAAEVAANAMNTFNLAAKDLPRVADLLAGAANASAVDVGELAQALQQAGAVANLAGLSLDDTTLAIAAMGNAGIKGSDAGTSLKTFLQNLQPVTEKQTALFRELGIVTADGTNAFYDATGSLKPLTEISGVLSKSLVGMTDAQKQMALEMMFGSDAIRAAAIVANTGAKGFQELGTEINKVKAADVAKTRMDNLAGSIEQLKGSIETLLIIIGKPLADSLRVVVDRVTGLVNWFSELDTGTIKMIGSIASIVASFLIAAGAVLVLVAAVQKIKMAWLSIQALFMANPFGLVLAAIALVGVAIYQLYKRSETFRNGFNKVFASVQAFVLPILSAISKGFKAFWSTLTTGFTTDQSSGIEEFAITVRNAFFSVRDFLVNDFLPAAQKVFGWIRDNVVPVFQAVYDKLGPIKIALIAVAAVFAATFGIVPTLIAAVVAGLIYAYTHFEGFRNVVDTVIAVVMAVGKWLFWLGKEVVERVVSGFDWLKTNVFPVFVALGELVVAVVGLISKVISFLMPLFQVIFGGIATIVKVQFAIIKAVFDIFINIITTLWRNFGDNLWQAIMIVWNIIKQTVEGALQVIKGIIQVLTGIISGDWGKAWEGLKNVFVGIWNVISAIPEQALNIIKLAIETAFDTILSLFQILKDTVITLFQTMWKVVSTIVKGLVDAIVGLFKWLWNTLVGHSIIPDMINGIVKWFLSLPGKVLGSIRGFVDSVISFFARLASSIGDKIREAVSTVASFPGKVLSALGDLGSMLFGAGKRLIQGLIDGVKSMAGAAANAAKNVVSGIKNFLPFSPAKEGPFSGKGNPYYSGQAIVGLLAKGMESQMGMLSRASAVVATGAQPSAVGNTSNTTTNSPSVQFVFPNVTSSKEAEAVKEAVMSPDVLAALTRSLRAGVGSN